MPGSIEKAWPGSSGVRVAGDDVRVLVLLDADAVAGAVDELLAPAGLGDDPPGRGVDLLARRADDRRGHRGLLGVEQHGVGLGHLRSGSPRNTQRVMSEQ